MEKTKTTKTPTSQSAPTTPTAEKGSKIPKTPAAPRKPRQTKAEKDKPYYVLNIYVEDEKLKEVYKTKVEEKNKLMIEDYLSETNKEQTYFDAGIDLYVPEDMTVNKSSTEKVNHLIRCSMYKVDSRKSYSPVCYYLYPRSSTGSKTPLRLANSVGIIDSGYRGNIIAVFDNISQDAYKIEKIDRLTQICAPNIEYPIKVNIVDTLECLGKTERGSKGFGSSGK